MRRGLHKLTLSCLLLPFSLSAARILHSLFPCLSPVSLLYSSCPLSIEEQRGALARAGERKRLALGGQLLLEESVAGVELGTRLSGVLREETEDTGVRGHQS